VDACKCGEYSMPMTLARDKDARSYPAKGLAASLGWHLVRSNHLSDSPTVRG
jgi:hypothetical protein